jgi:hypothetical protein
VSFKPRYFAGVLIGTAAVATIGATPLAVADPMAGDGPASSTIAALKAEGYNVEINWVNGFDTETVVAMLGDRDQQSQRFNKRPCDIHDGLRRRLLPESPRLTAFGLWAARSHRCATVAGRVSSAIAMSSHLGRLVRSRQAPGMPPRGSFSGQ